MDVEDKHDLSQTSSSATPPEPAEKRPRRTDSDSSTMAFFENLDAVKLDNPGEPMPQQSITIPACQDFASILANALKTPEVKASMGEIIQDRLEKIHDDYEKRLREVEAKNMQLGVENAELKQRVVNCEAEIEELQQYGRRNAVRITNGWPETDDENTDELVLKITNKFMGLDIKPDQISRSHRVGRYNPQGQTPRAILVKFTSYRIRESVYKARKKLRRHKDAREIYINEDLTKMRAQLSAKARRLKADKWILDAWTYDGRIFVKDTNNRTHLVKNDSDLDRFNRGLEPGFYDSRIRLFESPTETAAETSPASPGSQRGS